MNVTAPNPIPDRVVFGFFGDHFPRKQDQLIPVAPPVMALLEDGSMFTTDRFWSACHPDQIAVIKI